MRPEFIRHPADLTIDQLLPDRPTVGPDVSAVLWRLIRVVGIYQLLGEETPMRLYFTGKNVGKMLKVKTIEELQAELMKLKIGKISVANEEPEMVRVGIAECLTCAGIKPALGGPICQFEAGIVAGALENVYSGAKVSAEEKKCIGGLGDEVCLMECRILRFD